MGSLATYGFIVTYALVCIALPRYLRDHGAYRSQAQIISWLACGAMVMALVGNLYPVPDGPYGKLPYIYLIFLLAGLLSFAVRGRTPRSGLAEAED
jgi:amino acid transporter